jgi:hypothetical protein
MVITFWRSAYVCLSWVFILCAFVLGGALNFLSFGVQVTCFWRFRTQIRGCFFWQSIPTLGVNIFYGVL